MMRQPGVSCCAHLRRMWGRSRCNDGLRHISEERDHRHTWKQAPATKSIKGLRREAQAFFIGERNGVAIMSPNLDNMALENGSTAWWLAGRG
jgi:hypothetical protein